MAWFTLPQHGGPASVRNTALQLARAPVALLLGDDIFAPPDLVARHIAWHAAHAAETDALLGHSAWDETMPPNALMRWLEHGGRRFAFDYQVLSAGRPVSGFSFYTCHVSFKRGLFQRAGGFDESFPFASHEDLELGLRMERQGMRLYYDPTLIVRHWHWLDMASVCRRIYHMGYSSVEFWHKNSASLSMPRASARCMVMICFRFPPIRRIMLHLAAPTGLTQARPLRWTLLLYGMYWIGVADAAKGRSAVPPEPPV
jgi:GT2 family glycosyltransferase